MITSDMLRHAADKIEQGMGYFVCHALADEVYSRERDAGLTMEAAIRRAEAFLWPLLKRDGLQTCGEWSEHAQTLPKGQRHTPRVEWCRKIAAEMEAAEVPQ